MNNQQYYFLLNIIMLRTDVLEHYLLKILVRNYDRLSSLCPMGLLGDGKNALLPNL